VRRVRILICACDAPLRPLTNGYGQWLTGIVSELSRRHDVRLIGYRMAAQDGPPSVEAKLRIVPYEKPRAAGNAADLAKAMAFRRPLRAARMAEGLRGPLREELRHFRPDVVQVGTGKLSGLLRELGGRPAILHVQDTWHVNVEARAAESNGLRRALLEADARRIERFEARRYRGWDRVVACNPDDMRTLLALDPTLPMTFVPIGVNAAAFAPDPTAVRDPSRIVFHGNMGYAPNVACAEFLARDILPLVRTVRPDAHLAIVGRDPSPAVRALDALEHVHVVGGVDDIRSWISGSRVWAGPFRSGTGMKTKVLEAMATDTPAVVTPIGGRGIDIDSGALLVGSTPAELAAHIRAVLDDDDLAARLGRAGGDLVRERNAWPAVGRAFERMYEDVIAERAALAAAG
jgi:glycosyltransferase involved in cell wall biosynthesis